MPIQQTETEVVLTHPNDSTSSVRILKFGATVLSWKAQGKEQLWLSEGTVFDGSGAVRGGIPLVFPVFGKCEDDNHPTAELPMHGIARLHTWKVVPSKDPATVQFRLCHEDLTESARSQWPNDFSLLFSISLPSPATLVTHFSVENTGKKSFDFQFLFHTYFRVSDAGNVNVTGLKGLPALDKISNTRYIENNESLAISQEKETARVYSDLSSETMLTVQQGRNTVLTIEDHKNLNDVVVWNPWMERAKIIDDFAPKDRYKNMVCVEVGSVNKWVQLSRGEKWEGSQTVKASL
jgi:glucose-6-phosphate 1-epimerase